MKIELKKKPKNPIIIEGFPGFGLVGTIAAEFLINHLKTERIGRVWFEELPPMVAIHEGKAVDPIGIFYNKEHNIVIIYGITMGIGIEGKISNAVLEIARQLQAKEIISIEGIGSTAPSGETKAFHYTSDLQRNKRLIATGSLPLKEGIIVGVTGMLILNAKDIPMTAIFAEAHSRLPDSKAAAKTIEILDKYLNLKVDYTPLIVQAERFEEKLKDIIEKAKSIAQAKRRRRLSYVG